MREYKFRAYQTWCKGTEDEYSEWSHFTIHEVRAIEDLGPEVKIMQYIGRKDVKGKKIYEGDIARYRCDGYGWTFINCVIGYIEDEASFFAIHNDEYGNSRFYSLINSQVAYEVIGNIHQNPELLEVAE